MLARDERVSEFIVFWEKKFDMGKGALQNRLKSERARSVYITRNTPEKYDIISNTIKRIMKIFYL